MGVVGVVGVMRVVAMRMMPMRVVVVRMVAMRPVPVRVVPVPLQLTPPSQHQANFAFRATRVTRLWARALGERIVAKAEREHVQARGYLRARPPRATISPRGDVSVCPRDSTERTVRRTSTPSRAIELTICLSAVGSASLQGTSVVANRRLRATIMLPTGDGESWRRVSPALARCSARGEVVAACVYNKYATTKPAHVNCENGQAESGRGDFQSYSLKMGPWVCFDGFGGLPFWGKLSTCT